MVASCLKMYFIKNELVMKKLLVFFFAVSLVALLACQKYGEDRPVDFGSLPEAAQAFVKSHYADVKVLYVTKDDDIIFPDYTVRLENGVEIQFSKDGALEKLESPAGVPDGVVPVQIVEYVKAKYPGTVILDYEVDRASYEVKLSNRLELKFNSSFKLIEIDD